MYDIGIYNVYEYLATVRHDDINKEVHKLITEDENHAAKHISANADKCVICKKALKIFISAYGSEAGVAAMKFMPFNGK